MVLVAGSMTGAPKEGPVDGLMVVRAGEKNEVGVADVMRFLLVTGLQEKEGTECLDLRRPLARE